MNIGANTSDIKKDIKLTYSNAAKNIQQLEKKMLIDWWINKKINLGAVFLDCKQILEDMKSCYDYIGTMIFQKYPSTSTHNPNFPFFKKRSDFKNYMNKTFPTLYNTNKIYSLFESHQFYATGKGSHFKEFVDLVNKFKHGRLSNCEIRMTHMIELNPLPIKLNNIPHNQKLSLMQHTPPMIEYFTLILNAELSMLKSSSKILIVKDIKLTINGKLITPNGSVIQGPMQIDPGNVIKKNIDEISLIEFPDIFWKNSSLQIIFFLRKTLRELQNSIRKFFDEIGSQG